jgi:hypothetical protein
MPLVVMYGAKLTELRTESQSLLGRRILLIFMEFNMDVTTDVTGFDSCVCMYVYMYVCLSICISIHPSID